MIGGAGLFSPVHSSTVEEREASQTPRYPAAARLETERALGLYETSTSVEARGALETAIGLDPLSPHIRFAKARYASGLAARTTAVSNGFEAMTTGFPNQFVLSLNTFLILLWAVSLGLIGTAGAIVLRYARHVHHSLYELLRDKLGRHASIVAGVALLIPILWGAGLIATLVFFLLWFSPVLRSSERSMAVAVGVVGALLWIIHFLSPGPLHPPSEKHLPYRTAFLVEAGGSPGVSDSLTDAGDWGYASWARGLAAHRRGEWKVALAEFTNAARVLPKEPGIANNLGNVHLRLGNLDAARESYERAIALAPAAAAPHYNIAQVLTQELDFMAADEETQTALRLDYAGVTAFTESAATKDLLSTMDMLPREAPFWRATLKGEGVSGRLPVPNGFRILSPGGSVAFIPLGLLIMGFAGTFAGQWMRRTVRTYACGSCGKIVCRRCLIRIDGSPYCQDCGQTLSADCAAEYSRALLDRYFKKQVNVQGFVSTLVRWLLPGWGELSEWHVGRSVTVLTLCGAALLAVSLSGLPVTGHPADPPPTGLTGMPWVIGVLCYATARLIAWMWRTKSARALVREEDELDMPERRVSVG